MKAYAWLLLLLVGPAWAADSTTVSALPEAADVVLLTGHGSALGSDGHARALQRGDKLYGGDIVNSGADSYLNLHFRDGAFVLLRPNTRFQIDAYQYQAGPDPAPAPAAPTASVPAAKPAPTAAAAPASGSRAFLRLLRGGFRAVSGLLGHGQSDEFRLTTPVATIGIRGTDYLVILPNALEAAELEAQGGHQFAAAGGVLVGVIKGGIFMTNKAGKRMDVGEGQYAMTLKDGTQLLLPFQPNFLKLVPIPDPVQACP